MSNGIREGSRQALPRHCTDLGRSLGVYALAHVRVGERPSVRIDVSIEPWGE